jgi:hypothetical protein
MVNPWDCKVLFPGFFSPSSEGNTVAATPCPKGKYYGGGLPTEYCIDCPLGYITKELQSDVDGLPVGYQNQLACSKWG